MSTFGDPSRDFIELFLSTAPNAEPVLNVWVNLSDVESSCGHADSIVRDLAFEFELVKHCGDFAAMVHRDSNS